MSTICGIVNFDGAPVDKAALRRMAGAAAVADASGSIDYEVRGNVGFACQSLLSEAVGAGDPVPGICSKGDAVLTAAVRLDNRDELAGALASRPGDQVDVVSDAAMLLEAYVRWGERFHEHLQGAYAVAVWDRANGRLTLVRDPMGERSLYWHTTAHSILFASEPVQLLASGLAPPEYNDERVLAYLLGARPEPTWSFFRYVGRLPEGHMLEADPANVKLRAIWSMEGIERRPWSRPAAVLEMAQLLHSAVTRRVATRGETGVLLSGGLDSSSVAAEAASHQRQNGRQLYAVTWSSATGDGIDERLQSAALVRSRDNVLEITVEADHLWPLSRYPEAYWDPNDPGASAYPDLLLSSVESARESDVAVLMSGVGGDPVIGWRAPDLSLLLGGHMAILRRRLRQTGVRHASLRQQAGALRKRRLPAWLTDSSSRLAREAGLDRPLLPLGALTSRAGLRRHALADPANTATLERADRWSRKTGVRLASPWLDVDLVSFALSLPDGGVDLDAPSKSLLREAMAGRLPERLLVAPTTKSSRSRLRFTGLLSEKRNLVEGLLGSSHLANLGLLDGQEALRCFERMADQQAFMPGLWRIVTTECWLRTCTAYRRNGTSGQEAMT